MISKRTLLISFIFILLIGTSLSLYAWYRLQLSAVSSNSQAETYFDISSNESGSSIVSRLESKGIIRSSLATKIYLRVTDLGNKLSPGTYRVRPNLTTPEVLELLTHGPEDVKVTIPEGWRREQIAYRFESLLSVQDKEFNAKDFISKTASIEGELFPDTYFVSPKSNTDEIISQLRNNFSKKTHLNPKTADNVVKPDLTDREVLILASLIEREAKFPEDRPVIAGIIKKRLLADWPLQIDATIQYASDSINCRDTGSDCKWWQPIYDTKLPSSFNTYLHVGLPPQPICNPGLASIQAAKSPTDSPYWYYLTGTDGITRYSKTISEHNLYIDKYLKP